MNTAHISKVQRFSVGDGPGIRATVFFQGCNLHCPWCHNPETIPRQPMLLQYATRCTGCGACAAVCPCHAVQDGVHRLRRDDCTGCGRCVPVCPRDALEVSGTRRSVESLMAEILEDRDFYSASGGGVTLSGGEPLLQADACAALLDACTAQEIPLLLDTAGCVAYTAFQRLLPALRACYFDLKAGTPEGYRAIGGDLRLVLENMHRLTADGVDVTVRIPVIPGHNDSPAAAVSMAAAIAATGVQQVHLLPFHRLGSGKYAALQRPYPYAQTEPPTKALMNELASVFYKRGLSVTITN